MKRLLLFVLCLLLSTCFVGCGGDGAVSNDSVNNDNNQQDEEMDIANEAYFQLWNLSSHCDAMAGAIYSAWGYSIYYAKDDQDDMIKSGSRDGWEEFLLNRVVFRTSGLDSKEKLEESLVAITGSTNGIFWANALNNTSYAVAVAKKYNELVGDVESAKKLLDGSKECISKLADENASLTHKGELVDLYAILNTYYELATTPSGNYLSYGSNISNYKTNVSSKMNVLSIYFD